MTSCAAAKRRGRLAGMTEHHSTVRVRYAETDMMGVVYHGSYLPWLEIGRTDWLRSRGIPYRELEAEGYLLPVLEVAVAYRRPAKYDDELTIVTKIRARPTLRIRLDYEVRRGEEVLATAHTVHAFMDREGRAVRPPKRFVEAMRRLFEAEGE